MTERHNGLSKPPTEERTYGEMKYEDGTGPFADKKLPAGTGSGLSGTPEARAGTAPALFNSPDAAPAPSGEGR